MTTASRSTGALPWILLGAGAASRLFRLDDWSLWFDEETSIYFALNPGKPFPRAFPLYFWVLGRLFAMTGVSILSARLLSAAAGIATLWLAWRCIRRFAGDEIALPALALLILSPGHLFWSQSIRYYMLLMAFQIASVHAFLNALERRSLLWGSLTVGWLVLALLTNTTAALLVPVYVLALAWSLLGRGVTRRASWASVATAAVMLLLASTALTTLLRLHSHFGDQSSGYVLHLLLRFIVYAGLPAVALMVVALLFARLASTAFVFFALLAIVPVVELMALRTTGLWSVAWYHALIALLGVSAMGGYGWNVLERSLPRWAVMSAGASLVGASLLVVVSYFTTSHGDRPRWEEAAATLRQHGISAATTGVDVFSDAPGVVAFYLGVPPEQTMNSALVRQPPWSGEPGGTSRETWFVLEQRLLRREWRRWLDQSCERAAVFPGELIVRDRTVLVYRCSPSNVRFDR